MVRSFTLTDRALTTIQLGESHFREFKSALHGPPDQKEPREPKAIAEDVAETLVAFANADGGELLVGVEDNGQVTGCDRLKTSSLNLIEDSPRARVHRDTPLGHVKCARLHLHGRIVLYFSVLKSNSFVHSTSDGKCLLRRDLESIPIPAEQIIYDRKEKASRDYDRIFVDGASPADLNAELAQIVANDLSKGMTIEKCLQYLDLAEFTNNGLRLRRAALLLFASEVQSWHPRCQIRILKVEGTDLKTGDQYNISKDDTVSGNILQLLDAGWDGLRPHLVQTRLSEGARFESTVMFPELACREALTNAIAHRDYSDEGRAIEIYVFQDRMEVRSPGLLLSNITVEDLLKLEGVHQSRNSLIARVLREVRYMRELGEGMKRMFDLMQKSELSPPVLNNAAASFSITLKHKTVYSPEEVLWLDQFSILSLSREQKVIVALGKNGALIAPQDIWDNLGIVDTEYYRQLIKSLQDLKVLRTDVSKIAAKNIARKARIGSRKIPRFRIVPPAQSDSLKIREVRAPRRVQRAESAELDAPDAEARIYIGNIDYTITESELTQFLADFGSVENVFIPKIGHRNKGYAFAEFSSEQEAVLAIQRLDGQTFKERRISARKADPPKRK